MSHKSILVVLLVVIVAIAVVVVLRSEFYGARPSGAARGNQSQSRDLAVENFLFKDLPVLKEKFDVNKLQKIHRGLTEDEVRSILGPPSDVGDNHAVLQDALQGNPNPLPSSCYYLRYRYQDDTIMVLVFNRESRRMVDYLTRSWAIGPPEF